MFLQDRMHGVLLSRVQIQRLGEARFGIRTAGAAESTAGTLCESQSGCGDRK